MMLYTVPETLRKAFESYEKALEDNDVEALSAFFDRDSAQAPVWRADSAGLLVGHDNIAHFRKDRGPLPRRIKMNEIVRMMGDNIAVCVRTFNRITGGRILQTQVWNYSTETHRWLIVAAHVTYPTPALDSRIWRIVGTPLISGSSDGPLSGMSLAVKDLYAISGFSIGAGNEEFLRERPPEQKNASVVQTLLDAGCDITGITRTDEFAFSLTGTDSPYGIVPHAEYPGRVSGGSSAGSATATALGQVDIGLGTDTGGSIRVPASYQGLWGIRTTHGLVPTDGLLPLSQSFDTVGWMTRDAESLRRVARVLIPSKGKAPMIDGDRIYWCDDIYTSVDSDVQAACRSFGSRLEKSVVRYSKFSEFLAIGNTDCVTILTYWLSVFQTIQGYEAWRNHGDWVSSHLHGFGVSVASRFLKGSKYTYEQYKQALEEKKQLEELIDDAMGDGVLILPSASSCAPAVENSRSNSLAFAGIRGVTMCLTSIGGITGRPVVNVPLRVNSGFPCGISFLGPRGSDIQLIELAAKVSDK